MEATSFTILQKRQNELREKEVSKNVGMGLKTCMVIEGWCDGS